MKATPFLTRLAAFGLVLAVPACGRSPAAPGAPREPAPTASTNSVGQITFVIVDGWSQLPVAGAAVTANGTQALTDDAGQVQFSAAPSGCLVIDVKATGFLDRRTCGSSSVREISLWPVANAGEGEVTRNWVFYYDRIDGEHWSLPFQIALVPALAARADVAETWAAAAQTIESVSRRRIRFVWVPDAPEEGFVLEAAVMPPSCSTAPPWPYEIGGFCVKNDPFVYFLDRLQVAPERLTDPQTALRALLSAVGIKTHTLPGLMNAARPEADFSVFERKTLGMIGLRLRTVTWPDYDQVQ